MFVLQTVLMLLQNSKNLMRAVLGAFVAAEVVSFKVNIATKWVICSSFLMEF